MKDSLRYKLPNENSVYCSGSFKEESDLNSVDGFFITDFNQDRFFTFQEDSEVKVGVKTIDVPLVQSKDEYLNTGKHFLSGLKSKRLDKAILSRVKLAEFKGASSDLFERLCDIYPDAFVYLVSSELFGTWIGATPEVLLRRTGNECTTMSLAGTKPISDSSTWGEKEKKEQGFVTQFIQEKLERFGVGKITQSELQTVSAGPVKHLRTDFTFQLAKNETLALASKLHPTPAVSGLPRKDAIELIKEHEKHDRFFYSGMIGLHTVDNSHLFVNLRCAQLFEGKIAMYLGGGYTKDSNVEAEWTETETKALTLLNAIKEL